MVKPTNVQKLTPTAEDRWWRKRIEKEEGTYVDKTVQPQQTKVLLNTLGAPQVVPLAVEDHLVGAGAVVRKPKPLEAAPSVVAALQQGTPGRAGSVAGSRAGGGSVAGSKARSEVRSQVSYPKTPTFSQAGGSITDSQIMGRLARLEQDLARERARREAAEVEMRQLLAAANATGGPQ